MAGFFDSECVRSVEAELGANTKVVNIFSDLVTRPFGRDCEVVGEVVTTTNTKHRFELLIHVDHTGTRFPNGTPLTQSTKLLKLVSKFLMSQR